MNRPKNAMRNGPAQWLARLPFRLIVAIRAAVLIGVLIGYGAGLRAVLDQGYIGLGFWSSAGLLLAEEVMVNLLIVCLLGVSAALLLTMYDSMTRNPDRSAFILLAVGVFLTGAYLGVDIFLRLGNAGSAAHLLHIVRATLEQAPPGRIISRFLLFLAALTILGQIIHMVFRTLEPRILPKNYRQYSVTLRAARMVAWFAGSRQLAAAAILVFLAGAAGMVAIKKDVKATTNVLLISIDTLRADHLGCYGYGRNTSPRIDELAAGAVVFEKAFSQAPWTLPSHATMFSSLRPSTHRADTYTSRLSPKILTVPEILRQNGYHTMAVTSHVLLTDLYGMDQGFARHHFNGGRDADAVTDKALEYLDSRNKNRPFFLFLHYFDVHSDYGAPAPYGDRFTDPAYSGNVTGARDNFYANAKTPEDLKHLADLYDGEIAFTDHHVGRLMDELKERGLFEDTLILLVADHGEEFLEHGHFEHKTLYDSVIHVPLIMKTPKQGDGMRVALPVRLLDLGPTILKTALGVAKVEGLPAMQGDDLGEQLSLSADPFGDTHAFSEQHRDVDPEGVSRMAIRSSGRKYIRAGSGNDEFYNMETDPGETANLLPGARREADDLLGRLRAAQDENLSLSEQLLGTHPAERERVYLDTETKQRLKALGYLTDE